MPRVSLVGCAVARGTLDRIGERASLHTHGRKTTSSAWYRPHTKARAATRPEVGADNYRQRLAVLVEAAGAREVRESGGVACCVGKRGGDGSDIKNAFENE